MTTWHWNPQRSIMMPTNLYELSVDYVIWFLWALLNGVDIVLTTVADGFKAVFPGRRASNLPKPRVVIVGASFAGLAAQHHLSSHSNELDVTVIDYKTYFEYTPGILRCFVDPSYYSKLAVPLSVLQKSGTRVITGEVINVEVEDANNVDRNEVTLKDGRKIPYDYLVLAAGSTYPGPIKPSPNQRTIAERQQQWNISASELEQAQTVAIVGAGAVGVELASEIRQKFPAGTKRVIMVDMAPTILPGLEPASIRYATKWLKDHDVELYLGSPLKKIDPKFIQFAEGTTVRVDAVYKCVGVAPNSNMLASGSSRSLTKSLQGPKKAVVVNNHLQVVGHSHIFCPGDMSFHVESNELNLAHTAELNGELVANNILRMISQESQQNGASSCSSKSSLLVYPDGVVGNSTTPKIYCLSLGKYDATLGFNQLVVNGCIGAIMKWLIEWTSVAAAAQRPVGHLFWAIAHYSSNLLSRTVLSNSATIKDKKF